MLEEARRITSMVLLEGGTAKGAVLEYQAIALAEKFQTLDEWLSKGGPLPLEWVKAVSKP